MLPQRYWHPSWKGLPVCQHLMPSINDLIIVTTSVPSSVWIPPPLSIIRKWHLLHPVPPILFVWNNRVTAATPKEATGPASAMAP